MHAETFFQSLRAIGRPADAIQKQKAEAVAAFQAEIEPYRQKAEELLATLKKFFRNLQPIIDEIKAAEVQDTQIGGWLFELDNKSNVLSDLRRLIEESKRVEWSSIAQTVYPDQVDTHKRAALVRHYRASFQPGNVQGRCKDLLGFISERAESLMNSQTLRPELLTTHVMPKPELARLITEFESRLL